MAFELPTFSRFDIICVLVDWVSVISPKDLHTLALTNSMLFWEAEKYRWKTLSIELAPRPGGKSINVASGVLFRVEDRPMRVVNLRLTVTNVIGYTVSLVAFVDRLLKETRRLRTLHFYDAQLLRVAFPLLRNFTSFSFKLTELAIYSHYNDIPHIPDFLISQPAIESLSIHTRWNPAAAPLPSDALPNLTAVSAWLDQVVCLVEGRPVRFLHLMVSAPMPAAELRTLEAMFQNVTQPITAISLVGNLARDVMFFLRYLSRFAPELRFLGCEWRADTADPIHEDCHLLRSFTKLECMRWRRGSVRPCGWDWATWNPRSYAGPSLRTVQHENTYGPDGVWRQSGGLWHLDLGGFISPPLAHHQRFLVRASPNVFCQITHFIRPRIHSRFNLSDAQCLPCSYSNYRS